MASKPSLCIFHLARGLAHVLINDGPQWTGGAEVQLSLLARALRRRDWPVTVVVRDYGQPDTMFTEDGIQLLKASRPGGGLPIARFFARTFPSGLQAARKADADIYLQMGIGWYTGLLARECIKRDRKFIFWIASIMDPWVNVRGRSTLKWHERWFGHRGLKDASVVIAQTEDENALMRQMYGRDCPIIPNVWPTDMANDAEKQPNTVFWAARYMPKKRPDMVIEVAKRLPDIQFRMAGGAVAGHEWLFEKVQSEASKLPNVEVLGFVPFNEIDRYYAEASCYLCTSTIEGFPNTFLQAWNHKTPVVSTFDPDGVLGTHSVGVAGETVDELADGVKMMCSAQGRVVGENCRRHIENEHSVEAVLPKLEQVLWDAMERL